MFILLSLAKYYKATINSTDIPSAYLNATVDEEIYMRLTRQMSEIAISLHPHLAEYVDDKGCLIVRVQKAINGLRQAGAH